MAFNESIPSDSFLSEMSDSPSEEPNGPSTRESCLADPKNVLHVQKNYLSRPETAGSDISQYFALAPAKLKPSASVNVQQNVRCDQESAIFDKSENHVSHGEISSVFRRPRVEFQRSNTQNTPEGAWTDKSHTTPPISLKTAAVHAQSTLQGNASAEEQADDTESPRNTHQRKDTSSHSTDTLLEPGEHEVLADGDQRSTNIFDDARQNSEETDVTSAAERPSPAPLTHEMLKSRDNRKNSALATSGGRPDRQHDPLQHHADQRHKVHKSKRKTQAKNGAALDLDGARTDKMSDQHALSEEDLLHLLLHRARDRTITEERQQEQLTIQHHTLQKSKERLQQDFHELKAENDNLLRDAEIARNDFDIFTGKYRKLKDWALAMNKEYASLRETGKYLKVSFTELKQESIRTREPIRVSLHDGEKALETLETVRSGLSSAQTSSQVLQTSLLAADNRIIAKDAEIQQLRENEQELKSHIKGLASNQIRLDKNNKWYQAQIVEVLQQVNTAINSKFDKLELDARFSKFTEALGELIQSDYKQQGNWTSMISTVTELSEKIAAIDRVVQASRCSEVNADVLRPLFEDVALIQKAIDGYISGMPMLRELENSNLRYEEQAQCHNFIQELLDAGRCSAEERERELLRLNAQLVQSITADGDGLAKAQITQRELDGVLQQKDTVGREIEETKSKIAELEMNNTMLRQELEDRKTRYDEEQHVMKTQHDSEVRILKDRAVDMEHRIRHEEQSRIGAKDEVIESQESLLQAKEDKISKLLTELRESEESSVQLNQRLNAKIATCSTLEAKFEKQNQRSIELEQRINDLGAVERHVSSLQNAIQSKDTEIKRLEEDRAKLHALEHKLEELQNDLMVKDRLSIELREKLDGLEGYPLQIQQLEDKAVQDAEETAILRSRLSSLEEEAVALRPLQESLRQKSTELQKLQVELKAVKHKSQQITGFESERRVLVERVRALEKEIQIMKPRAESVDALEHDNHIQKEKISQLVKQVGTLQQKKAKPDVPAHHGEILGCTLQAQAPISVDGTHHEILENVFTQNTDLSISTQASNNIFRISKPLESNDENSNVKLVLEKQNVNPRVLLKATPLEPTIGESENSQNSCSQTSFVPDSQADTLDDHNAHIGIIPRPPQEPFISQRTSSPLSDVDEEYLTHNQGDNDTSQSNNLKSILDSSYPGHSSSEFRISNKNRTQCYASRLGSSASAHRPVSASSHEEMLLKSSDQSRQATSSPLKNCYPHPKVDRADADSEEMQKSQANVHDPSPRRLRSISHTQRRSEASDDHSHSPNANSGYLPSRERNLPNSAAKRRLDPDNVSGHSSRRFANKRPKQSRDSVIDSSTNDLRNDATDSLPSGSRSGKVTNTAKPSAKPKLGRKPSRHSKYAAQFGG